MQVPLEEDDELEEEEVINDENFLGKRPLESPEAEEAPAVKRPRALSVKGDPLDAGFLEAREPLSSLNPQKVPPMLSPVRVQDGADLAPLSPEPPMLAPVAKSQAPAAKPLDAKSLAPRTKTKSSSPGQRTKSPKPAPSPATAGSPIRSPKPMTKEKKSPGRSKSPRSPKSPKVVTHVPQAPIRPETPSRTPLALAGERAGREALQVTHVHGVPEAMRPASENPPRRPAAPDRTIDDSIDAVIARACAEREPDPFAFSSGSESEGELFTSPRRMAGPEGAPPRAPAAPSTFPKAGSTPLPLSGGTSGSDNSWTMDASIDEVVRRAKLGAPPGLQLLSSPSASPPTPEPLHRLHGDRPRPPTSADVRRKLKKELRTKLRKKEKQRDRDRDRDRGKDRGKEKEKARERERDTGREPRHAWKGLLRDDESDACKFKVRDLEDGEAKARPKDGLLRRDRERHKDKKRDRDKGRKDKDKRDKDRAKDKGREDKVKVAPAPLVLPPKDAATPLFSPAVAARTPALLPSVSPLLPEKLFEEKEKPKEKEKKKDKKEKKKKKEKEKEKKEKERERERRERERREREKERHRHEKVSCPLPVGHLPAASTRSVGLGSSVLILNPRSL